MAAAAPSQPAQALYGMHFHDEAVGSLAKKVIHLATISMGIVCFETILELVLSNSIMATLREALLEQCEGQPVYGQDCQDTVDQAMANFQAYFYCLMVAACFCGIAIPCCGYQGARNNDKTSMCCFCGCNIFSSICGAIALFTQLQYLGQAVVLVSFLISISVLALHIASAYYGYRLYEHLGQGRVITVAPAYPAMMATQVQPAAAVLVQPDGQVAHPASAPSGQALV